MIRIDTVYRLVKALSNKDLAGNTMNIEKFNDFVYLAMYDVIKTNYGLPEEYQPGMPMPRISYEITQKIMDDLAFLKVRMGVDTSPITVDEYGRATKPKDYLHMSSASYNVITKDGKTIPYDFEILTDAEINSRRSCSITMPTKRNPIMGVYSNYFQFYPVDANYKNVELTYLRQPKTPKYVADVDEFDNEVFNETNSVHIELPTDNLHNIVRQVLGYIGIPLKESHLIEYSERLKTTGK